MKRYWILLKLARACFNKPDLRIGQIVASALGQHSAANAADIYYLQDATLSHVLTEFNKEMGDWNNS